MYLTSDILRAHGACADQVALVAKHWPDGAETTADVLREAVRMKFNITWLARFIPEPARAEYEKVHEAAWTECEKTRATAWAEYQKTREAALAEYRKTCTPARAECEKMCEAAWADYEKKCTAALAAALIDADPNV